MHHHLTKPFFETMQLVTSKVSLTVYSNLTKPFLKYYVGSIDPHSLGVLCLFAWFITLFLFSLLSFLDMHASLMIEITLYQAAQSSSLSSLSCEALENSSMLSSSLSYTFFFALPFPPIFLSSTNFAFFFVIPS